jgi:putative ABC transport system permease protein
MATLHHAQPGQTLVLGGLTLRVRGVWKDYARQFGTVAVDLAAYQRLTGDPRSNDLAFWLAPDADVPAIERALAARVAGLELARPAAIRAQSLRIFDRSFAVTRYLQGLALAIGLFGVVASFSAQVLARRREFGLLAHLGFTRRQTLAMVALEGAAWTTAGAAVGLVLGLLVAAVLVHVVNPQSFHWTMDLVVSPGPLLAMAGGVVLAAAVAAAWSARAALSVQAVRAVREDG